jgi:hypothetical protein
VKPFSSVDLSLNVSYDAETGVFHRLVTRPNSPLGSRADTKLDTHGYRVVRVCGREFRAHRLAWFLTYGTWPDGDVDHINRDRQDNRIANLRAATRRQNLGNAGLSSSNTTGAKGVHLFKATGKWQAYIAIDGKRKHIGYFETREAASFAYLAAAKKEFGEFACNG